MVNEAAFGINHNVTDPAVGPSPFPIVQFLSPIPRYAELGPAQFDQKRTGIVYHFLDTLSFVHGDHSMKAGVDIRLNRRSAESSSADHVQFSSLTDFQQPTARLSWLDGRHPELHYANENFSFFVQDDWKAHPRLSLNLGLRYRRQHRQP